MTGRRLLAAKAVIRDLYVTVRESSKARRA
jgi:hypothetical protein